MAARRDSDSTVQEPGQPVMTSTTDSTLKGDKGDKEVVLDEKAAQRQRNDATVVATATTRETSETACGSGIGVGDGEKKKEGKWKNGKRELTEDDEGVEEVLPVNWPWWKKWWIISIIFLVQMSMNFNTGIYNNAVSGLSEEYGLSEQAARVGSAVFLIAYAFGSELWAPWSEELGRWPIMQLSLFLVNIWQLPCALAPNYASIVVARVLGGLSSAGGSVTLAMVADMWEPDKQDWAVAFVVFSSVGGSSLGPLIGPFVEAYLSWRWVFWLQLIFGGFVQLLHLFTVPETRATIVLDREAKRRRKETGEEIWGPSEVKGSRISRHHIFVTWSRPFEMFFREPIVLFCSLLSGFSDALIFTFIESFTLVYGQWGFTPPHSALTFVPIWIGYIIGYVSYVIPINRNMRMRLRDPKRYEPEKELSWLLLLAPLEPIGLFIFAWTSYGPPKTPWIAPMIASALVGIANYSIYESTIQYMMLAYGPYSASATGGNALARDGLAGIATMYATPLYNRLGNQWATTLLALLALVLQIPIFWFKYKGTWIREHSKFACEIMEDREKRKKHHVLLDERAEEGTEWAP